MVQNFQDSQPTPSKSNQKIDSIIDQNKQALKTAGEALQMIASYKKKYQEVVDFIQAKYSQQDLSEQNIKKYLGKLKETNPQEYARLQEYAESIEERLRFKTHFFNEEDSSTDSQSKRHRTKMIKTRRNWIPMR